MFTSLQLIGTVCTSSESAGIKNRLLDKCKEPVCSFALYALDPLALSFLNQILIAETADRC